MKEMGVVFLKNYGIVGANEIDRCENGFGYSASDSSGIVGGVFISFCPNKCGMQIKISLDGAKVGFRGMDFNKKWSQWTFVYR